MGQSGEKLTVASAVSVSRRPVINDYTLFLCSAHGDHSLRPPTCVTTCTAGSRPYLKKDIDLLEKVQWSATRLMTSDKSLSYCDRLQKFGLTTLETRRLRGDLILEVFKMFKGFDNIKLNDFFQVVKHKFERTYIQNLQNTGAFGC